MTDNRVIYFVLSCSLVKQDQFYNHTIRQNCWMTQVVPTLKCFLNLFYIMHSPVRDDFNKQIQYAFTPVTFISFIPDPGSWAELWLYKNAVNKELSHEAGHFKATFIENRSYSFMKIAQTHESAEWTPEVVKLCANRPPQQKFTMVTMSFC